MHTTTLLPLIIAALVLALIGLAVYSRRTAESAREDGYEEGYSDANRDAHERTTALNHDIARLQELAIATRAEHTQALEATMLDCDARIAIFAARAVSGEDLLTLGIAHKQLLLAVQTYTNLQLADQARFALTAAQRLEQLSKRAADAFQGTTQEAAA